MKAKEYQYIIIGSGVAGATVALKLLEADPTTSILILEAGPEVAMKDRRFWWDYVTQRNTGYKPYNHTEDTNGNNPSVGKTQWNSKGSRAMLYGGSTVHWGGWSMRFKPEDFQLRSNTKSLSNPKGFGADWPYDYDTLEPYYSQADQFLSVCGDENDSAKKGEPQGAKNDPYRSQPYPVPPNEWTESDGEMIEAFRALNITPGRMPIARYRKCMATGSCKYCPLGARFSASFIMDDLLSDPRYTNLEYLGMAPVTKLITETKSKIAGVEFLDPISREPRTVAGIRTVICSGAYEAPKLLQASKTNDWPWGIGNGDPEKKQDLVGRFAISHPFLSVSGTKPTNERRWLQEYDFPSLMSRTYDSPEYQANGKIFLMKYSGAPNVDIAEEMVSGKNHEAIDKKVTGERQVQLSAFMEERGQFENRFSIGEGRGLSDLPKTKIDFAHPEDFEERAYKNLLLMGQVLKKMGCDNIVPRIGSQDGHHTSSTTRMANSPDEGVVDPDLKVFGTDNLYICSNSVHPTCAAVNPTLTLTAVTLKLVDHLLSNK